MTSHPFTDLVDEEYVRSLPPTESQEHIVTLKDLEHKYFNSSSLPKHAARKWHIPVNHPIRRQLWPFLISKYLHTSIDIPSEKEGRRSGGSPTPITDDETPQPSPERRSLLLGQEWADRRLQPTYHLNTRGRAIHLAVLHDLAVSRPDIVYAPHVWPLAALFLHYFRPRTVLACLHALLDDVSDERVAQSKGLWRSRALALEAYLDEKSFAALPRRLFNLPPVEREFRGNKMRWRKKRGVEQKRNDVLAMWPIAMWFVPFECLVPIVDCYLVEGVKVLFRVGLVLGRLSMQEARRGEEEDEEEEAKASIKGDEDGEGSTDLLKSVAIAYPALKPRSLLKEAIKIRHFSRRNIDAAVRQAGKEWRASNGNVDVVDNLVMPCVLPGQRTYTAYSQVRAEFEARRSAATASSASSPRSFTNVSQLITAKELDFLLHEVHEENIAQFCLPKLIFTTRRDGCSLQTLYRLCGLHAEATRRPHTLILVATTSGKGLFGAFTTSLWSPDESRGFYGCGLSFLFRLRPTPAVIYKWRRDRGLELFQRATISELEVGGGVGAGPPGLRLDAGLQMGQSGPSPTFASKCLVTVPEDRINEGRCDHKSSSDRNEESGEYCSFKVAAVEVLGFVDSNSPEI